MNEENIVNACLKGNPLAQQKLFEMFAPKMLGVCLRYMKTDDEAEDVLQDAFVKIFTKLFDYKNRGSLEGWVRRIVVNTALDQLRKNTKFTHVYDIAELEYKLENVDSIFESLVAKDLMKLVNAMPNGYRVVFNMFAIEGYSHKEIAETLGVSESTSKSQYSRARSYLKEKLELIEGGESR
jgi:RNA polymerase sigma-70 factor (ECF subfamily)